MCTLVDATDVTIKAFFERFYLVSRRRTFALSINYPRASTPPTSHYEANSRFFCLLTWPLIFLVSTIRQVIWVLRLNHKCVWTIEPRIKPMCLNHEVTLVAGSIFGPLSQTHISKSEFKNGHISRFCSVCQVIQVISSAKFFSAEEVDLSFNPETKEHRQISHPSFRKRDREKNFLQMS